MDLGPLLAHQLDDGLIHPHPGTDVSDNSGLKNFLSLIYFNTIKIMTQSSLEERTPLASRTNDCKISVKSVDAFSDIKAFKPLKKSQILPYSQ